MGSPILGYQPACPGVRAVIEEEPVHVLIPASSGAGGQVEHGPRGRAVLVGHLQQLAGVALPPAARVAADQGAGQPGGQAGASSRAERGGGALPGGADDLPESDNMRPISSPVECAANLRIVIREDPSHTASYVTLCIRPSSRPVEKYPPMCTPSQQGQSAFRTALTNIMRVHERDGNHPQRAGVACRGSTGCWTRLTWEPRLGRGQLSFAGGGRHVAPRRNPLVFAVVFDKTMPAAPSRIPLGFLVICTGVLRIPA